MKKPNYKSLWIKLSLLTLTFTSVSGVALIKHHNEPVIEASAAPTVIVERASQTYIDNYYASINKSLTGSALTSALETLLKAERNNSFSYGSLQTTAFPYTDVDPLRPYDGYIVSFYSGTPVKGYTGMNKEHTWPNSHGGNFVENDPHMVRPTLSSENSARGNMYFAQYPNAGWDPGAESWGDPKYRGIAARVIFYSAVIGASSGLVLEDVGRGQDSGTVNRMGKLGDLLKWNFEYPVDPSEIIRNETLDISLNYNRNPFIDDPTLACKIWGDTNNNTKNICAQYSTPPTSMILSESSLTINIGDSATLSATLSPTTASQSVTWTSSNQNIVKVNNGVLTPVAVGTATVTATSTVDSSISASATITVTNIPIPVTGIDVTESSISIVIGGNKQINANVIPRSASNKNLSWLSNDTSIATVSSSGLVTGVKVGSTSITVTTVDGGYSATIAINVTETPVFQNETPGTDWQKVTSLIDVTDGKYVVMGGNNSKNIMGVSRGGSYQDCLTLSVAGTNTNLSSNTIINNTMVWEFKGLGNNKFTINSSKDGNNGYLYYTRSSNEVAYGSTAQTWTLSYSSNLFTITNDNTPTRILQYNSSAPRFAAYTSNQVKLSLYKYNPGKVLTGISVTSQPSKIVYDEGETFSPVGLVVKASYSDGTTKIVTPSYSTAPLTVGTTSITLTYSENGVTQSTSVPIQVVQAEGLYTIMAFDNTYKDPLDPAFLTIGKSKSGLKDLTFSNINNTRLNSSPNNNKTIVIGGNSYTGGEITITLPDGLVATSISFNGLLVDEGKTPTLTINDGSSFTYNGNTNETLYAFANKLHISTLGTSRIWMSSIMISAKTPSNAALDYGTMFLNKTANECTNSNVLTSTWASLSSLYSNADQDVKDVIKASSADANGTNLENAIARYNIIVSKYNYQDFIGTGVNNSIANHRHNNEQKSLAVLGITALTLSAIGFYLFKNKKKKDNIN